MTESLEQRQLMSASPLVPEMAAASSAAIVAQADEAPVTNTTPIALDDAYAINGHQQLGANLLANDTDADGDPLSANLLNGPSHGTVALSADGLFTYTPDRRFDGVDTFTYQLSDGQADSDPATVSIAVSRVNDAPVAVSDSLRAEQDQPLDVPIESGLLANDHDANGDVLTASLVDGPQNGVLSLQPDGSLTYVPNTGFFGTDSFTYKANDGQADSNLTTVMLTVGATNDAPEAADDAYGVAENQTLTVDGPGVLANDTDANGDPLSPILVTGPRHGILALGADGSFQYTPNAGFHDTDTFSYKANDGQADSSLATVTITVVPADGAPTAADDAYSIQQDQPLSVAASGVLANDQDPNGDTLTAVTVDGPANGTLALGGDGSFQYTPNAGFHGTDTFTYKANDGQADSGLATVTITVVPADGAPTAADDAYSIQQDQPLSVAASGVLANDQDPNGDTLTAVTVDGPANGTLALGGDGSFQYTPNAGFHGIDTFTYKANDGQADSNLAAVTITVDPTDVAASDIKVTLDVSGSAFGPDAGTIWSGSTFWVSSYVQDLRSLPQGVVGGAIDLSFDASKVTPTGNVVYGGHFTNYRQGTADTAAGIIDEAGALTTEAAVGTETRAPFIAWEFRRNGDGAPNDANSQLTFTADPGEGTATILPGNFALVGLGTPVAWQNVSFDNTSLDLYLGDFNADGSVNHSDLAVWIPQSGSSSADARFDARFDLNADGQINDGDLAILMPRLYQPVLGGTGPQAAVASGATLSAASESGTREHGGNRLAAARSLRPASQVWDTDGEVEADWIDSLAQGGSREHSLMDQFAAVDQVLQAYEPLVGV